jgi:thioredoxin:protein disulfide reductase
MKTRRKPYWHVFAASIALALVAGFASQEAAKAQAMPNPASIVKATSYVSVDPVPQGQAFEAAVVMEISSGFHMNSHKPSEDYLIPTTVTADPPPGIKVVDTVYPAGELKKFTFSPNKPLDVYTGSVTLELKLAADPKLALGAMSIPVTLRYQACNDTACLPPVKVPVVVRFDVAAAGTTAHQIHPEIFTAKH